MAPPLSVTIMTAPVIPESRATIEQRKVSSYTKGYSQDHPDKSSGLAKFFSGVTMKRPLTQSGRPFNVFRTGSFQSQHTAATEHTDFSDRSARSDRQAVSAVAEDVPVVRRVRFALDKSEICPVLVRAEYTSEEKKASWFQEDEYAQITRECCKQVRKMEKGEQLRDKKYCSRGLESHTRRASDAKSRTRKASIEAVLYEQDRQYEEGIEDDELISQFYIDSSSSSQLWAHRVALQDQRAAEETMDDFC